MRIYPYTALVLLLTSSVFSEPLTFEGAITQFTAHNYDLQLARQEANKSQADLTTAQRRPNPVLSGSYDYWDVKHHFKDTSPSAAALLTLHIDHPIELGGKRNRRIDVATLGIEYANSMFDETKREQLFGLIDAYYQVQADDANLQNATANANDFDHLLKIAQAKYDHGFLSELDLEKLQLQRIDYQNEVQSNTATLLADKEALALLLALKTKEMEVASITAPEKFSSPMEDLIGYAQTHRADCVAAEKNIKLSNASVTLEKANAIPDLTVGMETENYAPTYPGPLVGISASLPLPIYDHNQGGIQRARITALQATTQRTKVLAQAQSEVTQSFIHYQSQMAIYTAMQRGFTSAKSIKEKQEKIFTLKGISILELLDAQKSYREYQKNFTQSLIDLHIAQEQLKLTAGISIMPQK